MKKKLGVKLMSPSLFAGLFAVLAVGIVSTTNLPLGGTAYAQTSNAQISSAQISNAKTVVEQAKAKGLVGEQIDGYLGFVKNDIPAQVRTAVNEINIKRKSVYTKIAREKGVSVSDVAGLSGEKLVAKAKPGTSVKLADGQWHTV